MNSSQESLSSSNALIPVSYELAIDIDPSRTNFKGSLRISTKFNSNNSDDNDSRSFKLHCKDIIILSAKAGKHGENLQNLKVSYDRQGQTAIFHAQEPLNDSDEIELQYVGRINSIKTPRDVTTGVFQTNFMDQETGTSDNYVISTHCQPTYARTILPCLDEPDVKAHFQLQVKTWQRFKVISNVAAISHENQEANDKNADNNNNNWQIVKFGRTPAMATSLFGFTIGDFEFISTQIKSTSGSKTIPLRIFSPWEITQAAFALDTVQKYLPILEQFFGQSYPLDKLDFVLLPFLTDMAMENFGMISIQTSHLLIPPSMLADVYTRQQLMQLIVHELVHQWVGNYVSFDSWCHLWFNESFATFTACHVLEANGDLPNYWNSDAYLWQQTESAILQDLRASTPSIAQASETAANARETVNLFDPHSYAKGISILRSIQLGVGESNFQSAIKNIFKGDNLLNRAVKPIEIFQQLNSHDWVDFFNSWYRTPGVPLLTVTVTEDGKKTKLVQQRMVEDSNEDDDTIYPISLFTKLTNGELDKKHIIMPEKSLTLDYPIALCNHDSQGYYLVSYESAQCYDQLGQQLALGNLSEIDLVKVFNDLSHLIGNLKYQSHIHLQGLYQLLSQLASDKVDLQKFPQYWHGLSQGLDILQTVQLAIRTYGSNNLGKFHDSIVAPLVRKISWPQETFSQNYNYYEIKTMSQVMFLAQEMPEMVTICRKYFKHVLQGPNYSIPSDLVGSILAVVSRNSTTLKQYKSLFEMVKSSKAIVNHVFGLEGDSDKLSLELQNYAITNMGFSIDSNLINKLLNFVATNIDSTSIELALFGLAYNARFHPTGTANNNVQIRDIVVDWFKRHYDQWAQRALKPGFASAERMKKSLSNISIVVFQMFVDTPESIDTFALIKQSKFGKELGVYELWQIVKRNEMPKMKIYQSILGF
ncbi:ZYRO0C15070p [Zygosaccharomyces rouxii]|uniref:Aminopeptidase n=1 Tax=Zygosaccharomyces rouxii (strain ATCC 2623 / CBS 732 / NBRC 1130 / NCYC 568 / NRRL Y-229) TaxID=559307 RepID=C5DU99_ZYGRC|nr:uncharacterized protein ZYRO0C15070g [Zygosaccharomyces rouxii]KAH9201466.1 peptidase family M1-domain-containing protein [Zygosaccharomyces rouxii]CAR27360.1 ZYRO0C15070p [Zygosaccharomyces rouxii]